MDAPLGDAIGCNAEVREAVAILGGKRNALSELSLFLLAEKLLAQAFSLPEKEARARVEEAIASGAALKKLAEIVAAQGGGRARRVRCPRSCPSPPREAVLRAEEDGVLRVAARKLGEACLLLGGGRQHAEDAIDTHRRQSC